MFRCPECRTRRADWHLFRKHVQEAEHEVCVCGGYHYAHRPGSPYCVRNPWSEYREAERQGASPEILKDIVAHIGFEKRHKCGKEPPF